MHQRRNVNHDHDGNVIFIGDIIAYIEQNKKFINNSEQEKFMINDFHPEPTLEELGYKKSSKLEFLPPNINAIFSSDEFYRTGVISYVNVPTNIDISYISSLLTILVPEFINMKEQDQVEFTQVFVRKLHKESKLNFELSGYAGLGWNIKEFINNIKNFKMGKDLMRYVADFLNINIFILDIETDSLIYVGEKIFCKYKKNLFVIKIRENKFEPMFQINNNFMDHNSSIVNKLINSKFLVERLDCDFTHDKEEFDFIVGEEDLSKYSIAMQLPVNLDNEARTLDNKLNIRKIPINMIQDDPGMESDDNHEFEEIENDQNSTLTSVLVAKGISISDDKKIHGPLDSKVIAAKSHKSNKKIDNKTNQDQEQEHEQDQDKKLKKSVPTKKIKAKLSHTVLELKEIAKKAGIKLTFIRNNKTVNKTKQMLIDDINACS
jgi:hypothetical protein